jgi:hypothetical protein
LPGAFGAGEVPSVGFVTACGARLPGRLRRRFFFVPSLPALGAGVMEQG